MPLKDAAEFMVQTLKIGISMGYESVCREHLSTAV
jgi:hypothetical protein